MALPAGPKGTGDALGLREIALRERAQELERDDRQRHRDHIYRLSVLALSGFVCIGLLCYLGWAFRGDPKGFVASLSEVFKDCLLYTSRCV